MYKNIGEKIKGLAIGTFIAAAVGVCAYCIIMVRTGLMTVLVAYICAVLGMLLSWIATWLVYGFGELIDKATEIAENTRKETNQYNEEE